jgi:hypothetical protein
MYYPSVWLVTNAKIPHREPLCEISSNSPDFRVFAFQRFNVSLFVSAGYWVNVRPTFCDFNLYKTEQSCFLLLLILVTRSEAVLRLWWQPITVRDIAGKFAFITMPPAFCCSMHG